MARVIQFLFVIQIALFGISPISAVGQEKKLDKSAPPSELSSQEMADAMAAVMPGKVHEQFAKLEGKWNVASSLSMAGMDPQTNEGTAELKMILGGRFVQETGSGSMMGFPVEHSRIWGYNNGSKKYQAVWLYTMSTGFLQMEGTSTDEGKTIEWKGHFENEIGAREELSALTTFIDDDHFEIELAAGKMPDGSEGPKLNAVYTRDK